MALQLMLLFIAHAFFTAQAQPKDMDLFFIRHVTSVFNSGESRITKDAGGVESRRAYFSAGWAQQEVQSFRDQAFR